MRGRGGEKRERERDKSEGEGERQNRQQAIQRTQATTILQGTRECVIIKMVVQVIRIQIHYYYPPSTYNTILLSTHTHK